MTPQTFITKWGPGGPAFHLNEEQGAQSHFIDLCDLLGVPRPGTEAGYLFEEKNTVIGGRTGYADVFKRGAFAWVETFPFPEGLTPADTAHQQTEAITGGALIPAGLSSFPVRAELVEALPNAKTPSTGSGRTDGDVRAAAEAIARAAKRLNDLREAWLNPPEWTQRVPEVIPLGMTASPYPDRILPKDGHDKDLAERMLTKLYNQRPAWLVAAHKELDTAVAAAYGWTDYTPDMPDEEILKRLLARNLERSRAA